MYLHDVLTSKMLSQIVHVVYVKYQTQLRIFAIFLNEFNKVFIRYIHASQTYPNGSQTFIQHPGPEYISSQSFDLSRQSEECDWLRTEVVTNWDMWLARVCLGQNLDWCFNRWPFLVFFHFYLRIFIMTHQEQHFFNMIKLTYSGPCILWQPIQPENVILNWRWLENGVMFKQCTENIKVVLLTGSLKTQESLIMEEILYCRNRCT